MKWILLNLALIIFSFVAKATNYYISSSTGNDANAGTQAAPFKTLAKLNAVTLAAGDNVFLKSGDTWNESLRINQSGTSGNPITYSAYGAGARPIITGFTSISAWANVSGSIYQSTSAIGSLSSCQMVTINGYPFAMGRYPNANAANGGYLTYQSGTSGNVTSNAISGAPNFVGAELVIRLNRFYIDRCRITAQTSTTVTYTPQSGNNPTAGFGMFFENSFAALDQHGEWYYDPSTKKLNIFLAATPSTYSIKATIIDTLVTSTSKSFVTLDNIEFNGANKAAISISGGNHFIVQNCTIRYVGRDGVVFSGANAHSILNTYIEFCNSKGVNAFVGQSGAITINRDTVKHTALFPGMAWVKSSEGAMNGVEIGATAIGSTVRRSIVIGTGYIGIRADMSNNTVVDSNYVDSTCLIKDDGGGIYTWNNNGGTLKTGFKIVHNVVLNSIGAPLGTNSTNPEGEGIYTDDLSNGGEIGWNTVSNARRAIYNHSTSNFNVHDNTVYNAEYVWRVQQDAGTSNGYTVKNNIFFARGSTQTAAYFNNVSVTTMGTLDSNYYCRPINETTSIKTTISGTTTDRTLANWQAFSGQDAHSHVTATTVTDVSKIRFEYNETAVSKTVDLSPNYYIEATTGASESGVITLQPYSSIILINVPAPPPTPATSLFFSQYEMTPSGGQAYDEFYWLNTNNASLTLTGVSFPADATYRIDLSGYAVAGNPNVNVYIDGVLVGSIALNSAVTRIFSTLTNQQITTGNHTVKLQLTNFSSGANNGRVGLLYFTQTTTASPPTYPYISKQPLANTITNNFLTETSFQSGHLRGFNLGSNGYNQSNANGGNVQAMIDMVATGANIARCFVEIERPSGDTYQFKSGELEKLDSTIVRAARYGYYVVPCLFADPSLNTDYWGNAARKTSIAHLWSTITNLYKNNTKVAGYDLINEPRENFNYAEVIKFQQQMIDTIRTVDNNHVVMVECVDNDMFAMMLPLYQYSHVVYSPHGYSPLKITHQGVSGEPTANVRNKYPFNTTSANLTAPQKFYNNITTQHNDVRTMTHRFHVPIFIGEFSCINWSPLNDSGNWTSTEWCKDNIRLLETEGWSWVYHAWRGDYPGWEAEIPSSYYNSFTFSNAAPVGLPSYNTWVSNRSSTAPTIVMLKTYFALNAGLTYYISNLGNTTNSGLDSLHPINTTRLLQLYNNNSGGNTYLFNRGETFYFTLPSISPTSTVTVGAYGNPSVQKPIMSHFTWINSIGWIATATPNVWSVNLNLPINIYGFTPKAVDMGNVGTLLVDGVIKGAKQTALNLLTNQWDYYSDGLSTLYVYSTSQPSSITSAIACTTGDQGMNIGDNMRLQDLNVWGFGGTGIRAISKTNVTITNCDVYEGGGSYLNTTTRYGAGISFDEGGENILVLGCNISQQYEAGFTWQAHSSTNLEPFINCVFYGNTTDSTESGFCPSAGFQGGGGFFNCTVENNTLNNAGNSWSHTVRPKDNQAIAIYQDAWLTTDDDLIFQNNRIVNPREGIYFLGGSATDPRFTSRYDSICMSSTILIRKNFNNAPTPYTYTLSTYPQFVAAQGYEIGSVWQDIIVCGEETIIPTPQDPNDFYWFNQ